MFDCPIAVYMCCYSKILLQNENQKCRMKLNQNEIRFLHNILHWNSKRSTSYRIPQQSGSKSSIKKLASTSLIDVGTNQIVNLHFTSMVRSTAQAHYLILAKSSLFVLVSTNRNQLIMPASQLQVTQLQVASNSKSLFILCED